MTPTNATHQPTPAAAAEPDVPAVILALETVSELADLIHRHRLAIAALRQAIEELSDELALREAQTLMTAEGTSAEKRKAAVTLRLAADGDYQALRRKERDLRRELAERQADIERAQVRIRITLGLLPTAQAVDALSGAEAVSAPEASRPGSSLGSERQEDGETAEG